MNASIDDNPFEGHQGIDPKDAFGDENEDMPF
jgi:hypothetical protein